MELPSHLTGEANHQARFLYVIFFSNQLSWDKSNRTYYIHALTQMINNSLCSLYMYNSLSFDLNIHQSACIRNILPSIHPSLRASSIFYQSSHSSTHSSIHHSTHPSIHPPIHPFIRRILYTVATLPECLTAPTELCVIIRHVSLATSCCRINDSFYRGDELKTYRTGRGDLTSCSIQSVVSVDLTVAKGSRASLRDHGTNSVLFVSSQTDRKTCLFWLHMFTP